MVTVKEHEGLCRLINACRQGADSTTPMSLVQEMIDKIPEEIWKDSSKTILDPAAGSGTFLVAAYWKMIQAGDTHENIIENRLFACEINLVYLKVLRDKLGLKNIYNKDFLQFNGSMKFDVVIGNPPYQDGNKSGGQNKLYMEFCKQSLQKLKSDGKLAFVTPTSVLLPSKRFTLVGNTNLKYVNFDANTHFSVGSKICSWIVDKSFVEGIVEVQSNNSISFNSSDEPIYNSAEFNISSIKIYDSVMSKCSKQKDSNKRMFKRNNHGYAFSSTPSPEHIYEIYSIARGVEKKTYTKRLPVFYGEKKVIISNTKALNESNIIVDTRDYGPSYFAIKVDKESQIDNIKSFVLSPFFVDLYQTFRQIRGGINSVLIDYCPIFDINKKWTNEEVKTFFERIN